MGLMRWARQVARISCVWGSKRTSPLAHAAHIDRAAHAVQVRSGEWAAMFMVGCSPSPVHIQPHLPAAHAWRGCRTSPL